MRKFGLIGLTVVILFSVSLSQKSFDEVEFLHNLKLSYYTLEATPLNNFVANVTSAKMDAFTKANWDTVNIPHLRIIWQRPNNIYLSEIKIPFKMNSKQQKEYRVLLNALKVQIRGIVLDLQRFYLVGILDETLMNNYILRNNEDAVQMTFKNIDDQGTNVKYLLGINGLCMMIDVEYPLQNKQMLIYPEFKTVDNKWLCQGWTVQNVLNGNVTSGFKLTVNYEQKNKIWLPVSFFLEVQKADKKDKIFYDEIRLFNYRLNQKIDVATGKH